MTTTDLSFEEARAHSRELFAADPLAGMDALFDAHDERAKRRLAQEAFAASIHATSTGQTRSGADIQLPSPAELAVVTLQERGLSREQALERVALQPNTVTELQAEIEQKRKSIIDRASVAESEAFARSPEGRRIAAEEAARKAEERRRLVTAARELLIEEGNAAEDVAALEPHEILDLAGVEPSERTLETRGEEQFRADQERQRAKWNAMTHDQQEAALDRMEDNQ